jgi:hypothetical protein
MVKKIEINYRRTCSCPDSHINCLTAKEWVRGQVAIWELYYERRDIRDKDIHPAVFPIALPTRANSDLLERFGYLSARGNERKELHTTVNAIEFNTLKGKPGFKIDIQDDKIALVTIKNEIVGYWDRETLKNSFERKLPKLLYVKAESRGQGSNEEFWFNEAWLLSGFDFDNFIRLIRAGTILIDIRIGQYPDGRPHDHGTGFRVFPDKLDLCFSHRERVI